MELKQIYDVKKLKLNFNDKQVLDIKTLKFHNGLIYGICGNFGSGKSSLLKVLSGDLKESSGTVMYQGKKFEKNFFGRIKKHNDIKFFDRDSINSSQKVKKIIKSKFPSKVQQIKSKHFINHRLESLWNSPVKLISEGEKHWLKTVLAVEHDPRVLLIDDYGNNIDPRNESILRKKIIKMNNILGTTVLLSSYSDYFLKQFANILIYLDNGHISKIRKGFRKNFSSKK